MRQIEDTTNPTELFEIRQKYMSSGNYDVARKATPMQRNCYHSISKKSITSLVGFLFSPM